MTVFVLSILDITTVIAKHPSIEVWTIKKYNQGYLMIGGNHE